MSAPEGQETPPPHPDPGQVAPPLESAQIMNSHIYYSQGEEQDQRTPEFGVIVALTLREEGAPSIPCSNSSPGEPGPERQVPAVRRLETNGSPERHLVPSRETEVDGFS